MKKRRKLRSWHLAVVSVVAVLGATEGISWIANRLDPPKGGFCIQCRQAQDAERANKPLAGPHGIAPAPPLEMAQRKEQPHERKVEALDMTEVAGRNYIRSAKYLAVKPGIHRSRLKTTSGRLIFDVHNTIDEFGRREVPDQKEASRKRFLMVLGCSYTFGEGVENRETLPYYLSRLAQGYRVYNYGMHGHGPSDIVLRLRDSDLRREIPEREGEAVYLYIDAHLSRVFGSMSLVSTWGLTKPYFEQDPDGNLRFLGSFQDGRPWTTGFYRALWHSQFVQRYKVELPLKLSDADLTLFASLVLEMKNIIQAGAGLKRFRVVFLPGQRGSRLLVPFLEKLGIEYVNYGDWDMGKLVAEPAFLPFDGHPTPVLYKELSRYLVRDLGIE